MPTTKYGPFDVNVENSTIACGDKQQYLRPAEMFLLQFICAAGEGVLVSRLTLYEELCKFQGSAPRPAILDVYVCRVRKTLSALLDNGGGCLVTVHGTGYEFHATPLPRTNGRKRGKSRQGIRLKLWIAQERYSREQKNEPEIAPIFGRRAFQ